MSRTRAVVRNVASNYAGMVVTTAAGFITAPFLANQLGAGGYGLWLLIGSFTGYFGLLDLGVRGSVGRFIAYHRARNDNQALNETLTTAMALLCAPAALTLAGTAAATFLFFSLFDVPAEQAENVRVALLIAGANLALTFPLSVFDGVLWAHQRFDVINGVDAAVVAIRTAFVFQLVSRGYGLVTLALVMLLCTAISGPMKALMAYRVCPQLRVCADFVRRERIRSLFGYGVWYFVLSMGQMCASQLNRIMIGSLLGVALVTPFNFASTLIGHGVSLLVACTGVLTPIATAFHAEGQQEKQQRLFREGGRFCAFFGFCFAGGCLFLGQPFLQLWIPAHADMAYSILILLALGEILPMSQSITGNILLGAAKHRLVALLTIAEAGFLVGLTPTLIRFYGLTGAACSIATGAITFRGILLPFYACRRLDCAWTQFVSFSILPPFLHAIAPVLALATVTRICPARSWGGFLLHAAVYLVLCAAVGMHLLKAWPIWNTVLSLFVKSRSSTEA